MALSRLPISLLALNTGSLFSPTWILTLLWIPANATCSMLYGERSKPPQFNPILHHCNNNLIEHDVYGFLHHSATDVQELARNVEHQL
jgi:hypothetical protein